MEQHFNEKAWEFITLPEVELFTAFKGRKFPIFSTLYLDGEQSVNYCATQDDDTVYGDVEGYYVKVYDDEFFVNYSDIAFSIWLNGKPVEVDPYALEELKNIIPDGRTITEHEYDQIAQALRELVQENKG